MKTRVFFFYSKEKLRPSRRGKNQNILRTAMPKYGSGTFVSKYGVGVRVVSDSNVQILSTSFPAHCAFVALPPFDKLFTPPSLKNPRALNIVKLYGSGPRLTARPHPKELFL
jgi:hypothetical protein